MAVEQRDGASAIEMRAASGIEIRSDGDGVTVEGYAAVFNQEADIGGMFREQIAPGAFTDALKRDDVVFLINHEGLPLARTRSGTLELKQDDKGLRMRSQLDPADPDVMSIVGKMKRGDLDKMSFAFIADKQEWDDTGDVPLRTIQSAQLYDVSVVTTPAYDGTSIGLRSLEAHRQTKVKDAEAKANAASAHLRRMRMKVRHHPASKQEGAALR